SPSLANGTAVAFSVSARNSAPNSLATWNSATGSGIPAGPPLVTGTPPVASGSLTDGATASVSWAGVFHPNGKAIESYWAVITTGAVPACPPGGKVVHTDGTTTSAQFGGLTADVTYTITVYA